MITFIAGTITYILYPHANEIGGSAYAVLNS